MRKLKGMEISSNWRITLHLKNHT